MKKLFMIGVLSASLLSGCSSLGINKNVKKDFDCPAQDGFGCRSIESIRSMIVTGGAVPSASYNVATGPDVSVSGVPQWAPDVVLKVHVSNYVDAHGDYHDDSVIYVVARHGGWDIEQ